MMCKKVFCKVPKVTRENAKQVGATLVRFVCTSYTCVCIFVLIVNRFYMYVLAVGVSSQKVHINAMMAGLYLSIVRIELPLGTWSQCLISEYRPQYRLSIMKTANCQEILTINCNLLVQSVMYLLIRKVKLLSRSTRLHCTCSPVCEAN